MASKLLKKQIECTRFACVFPVSNAEIRNNATLRHRLRVHTLPIVVHSHTIVSTPWAVVSSRPAPRMEWREDRLIQLGIP